ncbi:MAG: hypothetical protein WB586_00165 [Chthoniobacterales bacterium]
MHLQPHGLEQTISRYRPEIVRQKKRDVTVAEFLSEVKAKADSNPKTIEGHCKSFRWYSIRGGHPLSTEAISTFKSSFGQRGTSFANINRSFKIFLLATMAGLRRKEIDLLEVGAFRWQHGVIRIEAHSTVSTKHGPSGGEPIEETPS